VVFGSGAMVAVVIYLFEQIRGQLHHPRAPSQ
jgi:hypothetical protein